MKDFLNRLGGDARKGLPVFVAGYLKRILESKYDTLIKTEWGQKLKNLGLPEKYSLEALANLTNAIADSRLPENSFLTKTLKEVALDAMPELSKRMINGNTISELGDKAKGRINNLIEANKLNDSREKELASLLLGLDSETLSSLLAWSYGVSERERVLIINLMRDFSPEELTKFGILPNESKERMLGLLRGASPEEEPEEERAGFLKRAGEDIGETLSEMTSSMARINAGLRKMREGKK